MQYKFAYPLVNVSFVAVLELVLFSLFFLLFDCFIVFFFLRLGGSIVKVESSSSSLFLSLLIKKAQKRLF